MISANCGPFVSVPIGQQTICAKNAPGETDPGGTMKSLSVAILIALAVSGLFFTIFHLFGVGSQVAAPLASSSLGLITFIHDKVDKAFSSGKSRVSPGIVPVSGFDIHWPFMLVYVILISVAVCELSSFIYGALAEFSSSLARIYDSAPDAFLETTAMLSIPAVAWGIFLLGRWVGIRTAKAGYWILPLGFAMGRAIEILAMYRFVPEARPSLTMAFDTKIGLISTTALGFFVIGCGEFGVWRGDRIRFGAYFNSLLKHVSGSTRQTLLSMTYEEAKNTKVPTT